MERLKHVWYYIKHHKKLSVFFVAVIIILLMVLWPKPPAPLEVQKVKTDDIAESISASGSIISQSSVDLTFPTAGKVTYLGVKKGDRVEAGQVIATLDQRTVQKNLESALRDYSKQRNTFEQGKEDNNMKNLVDAPNDKIKRILENNQYDLDKAVISVELQALAKEQSVLTTPISGVVTRADITSAGVNTALTSTFSIADPDNLVFRMEVDESDIGRVRSDQTAEVSLDAYPDNPLKLSISNIDFAAHTTSTGGNAFNVDANLPENDEMHYRVGMSGDGEITTREEKDVLVVPLSSTLNEEENEYVFVKKENAFEKRKVKLGIANDTEIQVKDGVKEGEEVALDPTEAAKRVVDTKKKQFLFF